MVGKTVLYKLSEGDVARIGEPEFFHSGPTRNGVTAGQVLPAIVTASFSGGDYLNLKVLLDGLGEYWATSRTEGDDPGQWRPLDAG